MTAKIKSHPPSHAIRHRHKPHGVKKHAFEKVYWPYLPVVVIVSAVLSFGSYGNALASKVRHPSGHVLAYSTSMSIQGLLNSTNSARGANGVTALSLNSKLDASAQAKANDMAAKDYWSHNTPSGDPPWIFIDAQGYAYQKLGENLATGFNSEQAAIDGWMASPPHRENLLDPAFVDVGFGYANIADYTAAGGGPMTIIVAHYGKPTVIAAQTPAPAPAAPVSSAPAPSKPASSAPASSAPSSQSTASPIQPTPSSSKNTKTQNNPLSTGSTSGGTVSSKIGSKGGVTLSLRTTRAQTVFADMPLTSLATGLSSFIMFGALGLWISKHLVALRRMFTRGEAYIIHHPMVDVALVLLVVIGFMLSQTVGFIQ
jgi:uncharacterized protein YkwD